MKTEEVKNINEGEKIKNEINMQKNENILLPIIHNIIKIKFYI